MRERNCCFVERENALKVRRICFPPFVQTVSKGIQTVTSPPTVCHIKSRGNALSSQWAVSYFTMYDLPGHLLDDELRGELREEEKHFHASMPRSPEKPARKTFSLYLFLLFRETKTRTKQISRNGTVHCRTVYKPTSIFFFVRDTFFSHFFMAVWNAFRQAKKFLFPRIHQPYLLLSGTPRSFSGTPQPINHDLDLFSLLLSTARMIPTLVFPSFLLPPQNCEISPPCGAIWENGVCVCARVVIFSPPRGGRRPRKCKRDRMYYSKTKEC